MTRRWFPDPRWLAWLLVPLAAAGCSLSVPGGNDDDAASASPTIAEATPTRAAPMAIVTPTPVPPDATAPSGTQPTQNPESYVVAEGDTLYGIAIRFGVDLNALIELNGLSDPNDIQVGQELKIPPKQ